MRTGLALDAKMPILFDIMRFVVSLSSGSFESLLAAASSDSSARGKPDPRI
jgi:hypothetical protein